MDEYIEREKIVFGVLGLTIVDPAVAAYADAVLHQIQSVPSADVAPVRHGRWLEVREKRLFGEHYFLCSNCKSRNGLMIPFNYCPNCGTKMDEGKV